MEGQLQSIKEKCQALLWGSECTPDGGPKGAVLCALRIAYAIFRDLAAGQLTLRAMSLVYTTLLSLVPLLAVSFSVLKGFGVHNQIEPMLLNLLTPLGDKGIEISQTIIGFVENMRVGVLGTVGLALLLYAVISLIQKIERSFNFIWRVEKSRPFAQRFSDYLSVILIGPVLVFSALGATASVMNTAVVQSLVAIQPFGYLVSIGVRMVPYLLVIAAFSFVYSFIPNTRVRLSSALIGAVVAGVLWQSVGWGFASFVVSSTSYTAIYSGFAILILFMIWLYLAWLILLIGASIAFYHQHGEYLISRKRELHLSPHQREQLALLAMHYIGAQHLAGGKPWTTEALATHLRVPQGGLQRILDALEKARLLSPDHANPPAYLPARALERISLQAIMETIRRAEEKDFLGPWKILRETSVEAVLEEVENAVSQALESRSLRTLLADSEEVKLAATENLKPLK